MDNKNLVLTPWEFHVLSLKLGLFDEVVSNGMRYDLYY